MDVEAVIRRSKEPMLNLYDASIPLTVQEFQPVVLDASDQAEIAGTMLSKPLVLRVSATKMKDSAPGRSPRRLWQKCW